MTGLNIILEGLVGSHAYGLNTEDSDKDWRGIYLAPTTEILGLVKPKPHYESISDAEDWVLYELEKFLGLALSNNPNILEILFLPSDNYRVIGGLGQTLLDLRYEFLSQQVRHTYGGYAMSQFKRLKTREEDGLEGFKSKLKKRYSKHARHCIRLLDQGKEILETGTLTVRVKDPDRLFTLGALPPKELYPIVEDLFAEFNEIKSDLRLEPDRAKFNDLLVAWRLAELP